MHLHCTCVAYVWGTNETENCQLVLRYYIENIYTQTFATSAMISQRNARSIGGGGGAYENKSHVIQNFEVYKKYACRWQLML